MAKRKIGCSKVKDGVARDWFVIPEKLPKGVYELLGEYQGNNIYKSSYDLKYLIVGNGTEFQGLQEIYKVNESDRKLHFTGRLVGYNDSNEEVGLANQKIVVKIGEYDNPLKLQSEERSLDATTLYTAKNEATIRTDSNGFFEFTGYIPTGYREWEYKLYIKYGGNYDYVSCVAEKVLHIGNAPTFTYLEVYPSNHLHPQGGFILKASVYLLKEIDENGHPIAGATKITSGNVLFKESNTGVNDSWITMLNDTSIESSGEKMSTQSLGRNDGIVLHRYMFNRDEDDVFEKYVYCQYSGSESDIGYKPSKSRVIHLSIDQYGVKIDNVTANFPCAVTVNDIVFVPYNAEKYCKLGLYYNNTPERTLPDGDCDMYIYQGE